MSFSNQPMPRNNEHQRAHELIMESRVDKLTHDQDAWLARHLSICEPCNQELESFSSAIRDLHTIACSITANSHIVRSTQLRVRERARELNAQDELMQPLWVAAALAFAWAVVSMPFMYQGFEWLGHRNNLPDMIWITGFLMMCLMPVAAVATVALATRHKRAHHQQHDPITG